MPIELERVAFDDVDGGKPLSQPGNEIAVNLDRGELHAALDQLHGERPLPRPDLEHELARLGLQRVRDPRENPRIGEKVLAEPAPRAVMHGEQ